MGTKYACIWHKKPRALWEVRGEGPYGKLEGDAS